MNDVTPEEMQLIMIARTLKPYETVELKLNDSGDVIFTHTSKNRYMILTGRKEIG